MKPSTKTHAMNKLGIFVGERGLWTFFRDIYNDLATHYDTSVFTPKEYPLPILSRRVNHWAYQHGMRKILQQSDVCFFEWASELLQLASHMPKYSPIITRLHSFELYEWAPKINWDKVDKIIFISEAIRSKFISLYPEQASKTALVYNSISTNKFTPVERKFGFSIGMLSTISPIKRIYEIILLVKELRDMGYSPTLHIAGGLKLAGSLDRYYVSVHRLVEKLDLKDAVTFYGNVSDPAGWLANIDIFISHSFWEGMQTALLEAMASGCYCLAHFWDGAEEALPPDNIYITETDLKKKIIAYSKITEEERREHKRLLVNIAREKFDIEDKKVIIREIIDSVI